MHQPISDNKGKNQKWAYDQFNLGVNCFTPKESEQNQNTARPVSQARYFSGLLIEQDKQDDQMDQAISHFHDALQVYTPIAFPDDWAATHYWLATAYGNRVRGGRGENIEQAITHYKQALEVYSRQWRPEKWAGTQIGLAGVYADLLKGDREKNLDQAALHCKQAMEVCTLQALPAVWGVCQMILGEIYIKRSGSQRTRNLEQAIHHFQQALEVYARCNIQEGPDRVQVLLETADQELCHRKQNPESGSKGCPYPLIYPQFYQEESQLQPGKKHTLKLVYAEVPDIPFAGQLLLLYRWEDEIHEEEARKLASRAIAYISCAIYDAAFSVGLFCNPSQVPNGRRPAWWLPEGEVAPVSLTLSDIDVSDKSCQMTIGPVAVWNVKQNGGREHLVMLQAAFRAKFSEIIV